MRDKRKSKLLLEKLLSSSKTLLLFTSAFVSLFTLLSISSTALADVNLRDGSFLTSTSEVKVGPFLLQRKYNSRSMDVGAFGFGWKSDLDRNVTIPKQLHVLRDKSSHLVTEIEQLTRLQNRIWHFRYHDLDLISVELELHKKKLILVQYRYDSVHNLTEIIYPDGSQEKITYFTNEDQVKSYQDQKQCLENYTYHQQISGTMLHSRTSVQHRCPASSTKNLTYQFWMRKQKNGTTVLVKARIASESKNVNLHFDRVSGLSLAGDN